jgi:hypothetical protein
MKLITRGLGTGGGTFLVSKALGGDISGAPNLASAIALDGHRLHITFSEPVNTDDAMVASNYYVTGDLRVLAVVMETETSYVLITSRQTPGFTYEVTAINIRDLTGVPI